MFDNPEIVDRPLVVTNPIGGSTNLSMICRNVVLSSHGCMFVCDCFVLGFTGFSIILGSRSTLKEWGGIRYLPSDGGNNWS